MSGDEGHQLKKMDVLSLVVALLMLSSLCLAKKPNLIAIFSDGVFDVGYNNPVMYTPTINSLSADGIRFDSNYGGNMCTPSRSQFLTGKHQIRYGLQHDVIRPDTPYGLPLDQVLLPTRLKKLGYSTHMVGKWHLGSYLTEYTPTKRGFDTFFGYHNGVMDSYNHSVQCPSDGADWGYDMWKQLTPVEPRLIDGVHDSFVYNREVRSVIDRHDEKDGPMFLYFPTHEIHPWPEFQAPQKYIDLYENRTEIQEIRNLGAKTTIVDDHVTNIVDALKANGLYDNSIIIFVSDQGYFPDGIPVEIFNLLFFPAPTVLAEANLRTIGWVHSPLLPKKARGRTVTDQIISMMDWMPTMLGLAGEKDPENGLEGKDIWDVLVNGGPPIRTELLHTINVAVPPVGVNSFPSTFDTRITAAYRIGDYKLITGCERWFPTVYNGVQMRLCDQFVLQGGNNYHLYNIKQDPTEQQDLAGDPLKKMVILQILDQLKAELANSVPPLHDLPSSAPTETACPKHHNGRFEPFNL